MGKTKIGVEQALADLAPSKSVKWKSGPYDAPLEPLVVTLSKLAKKTCKLCHGRGLVRLGKAKKRTMIRPTSCVCADKGYKKFMDKHIKMPCKICGKTKYCSHRIRTLPELLVKMAWADKIVDLALGDRPPNVADSSGDIQLGGPNAGRDEANGEGDEGSRGQDSQGTEPSAPNRATQGTA